LNWDEIAVLITGGNGFLGTNLVHRLIDLGVKKIRVVDNLDRDKQYNLQIFENNVEFINGDLRDQAVCYAACKGMNIVFHLASKVGSIGFYKEYATDVLSHNTTIDTQMLEAARSSNISCYVYISSAFVYPLSRMQEPFSTPISENEAIPAKPAISYGWAKLIGETALQYAVEQDNTIKGIIFRLSNFYGPHQSTDLERGSIIPVLIRRAIENPGLHPLPIFGSGNETRTYCYISDVLDAICIAVEKVKNYQIIGPLNVGSEEPIRIIDLTNKIIGISGKNIMVEKKSAPPPVTMSQTLDCSQAGLVLDGWEPKVSLQEGLEKMYAYVSDKMNQKNIVIDHNKY